MPNREMTERGQRDVEGGNGKKGKGNIPKGGKEITRKEEYGREVEDVKEE